MRRKGYKYRRVLLEYILMRISSNSLMQINKKLMEIKFMKMLKIFYNEKLTEEFLLKHCYNKHCNKFVPKNF